MTSRRIMAAAMLIAATLPVAAAETAAARKAACGLDRIREIIVGIDRAAPAEADTLITENTAAWVPDYNRFAVGEAAAQLRKLTDAVEGRPSRSQCRTLLPFAAVSLSAARLSQAGAAISAGSVLGPCADGSGLCVPEATQVIVEQCRVRLLDLPWQASC